MKTSVYRVDFLLNTSPWDAGSGEASDPWFRLYTDDVAVVAQFPDGGKVIGPKDAEGWSTQDYTVEVVHCIVDDRVVDEEVHQFRRDKGHLTPEDVSKVAGDPLWDASLRYIWLAGEPTAKSLEVINRRLNSWPGV